MKSNEWRARRAAALYKAGHAHDEIAERLGVSRATVYRDLKKTEKRPRPQMQPRGLTARNSEIADAYAKGGTLKSVGDRYGMTPRAVWHHVRRRRAAQ